jgi:type II secretory pathway pseudopilin PulG
MRKQRRAFMLLDAIVGLAILALLGVIIAAEMSWHARAAQRLANIRAASELAESALFDLQQGHPLHPDGGNDQTKVEQLAGGDPIPHSAWVRVTATHDGQSALLVGLVKADVVGDK